MKNLVTCIAAIILLSNDTLYGFDENFWINTTETVERNLRYVANIAANDGTIFAATGSGLWRSDNTGSSWKHVPISDFGIIAGANILGDGTIIVGGRDSLHFSTDAGENWTTISHLKHGIPQIDYYRFVERPDGRLFVAMRDWYSGQFVPSGIWESADRGRSWSLVCDNVENGLESLCIGLHPNGDVFWGSYLWKGLYVLRAETGECHNIYAPGGFGEREWDPLSMAINSRGQIMVGTDRPESAIFTSQDTGRSWKKYNHWNTYAPFGRIQTITVDRFDNFVVTARDTVWYTSDFAESWTRLPGYLDQFEYITSTCLDSLDYLYVGTDEGHIYRSREPIYTTTGITDNQPVNSKFNFSLSPNPTTGDLTLDFTLETQGLVTAELFDMRGVLLKQLFSREFSTGTHRERAVVTSLASGVCVLHIRTRSEVLNSLVFLTD